MATPNPPLWLPSGSVRSIIALALIGAVIGGVFAGIEVKEIIALVGPIVGFYFGAKAKSA